MDYIEKTFKKTLEALKKPEMKILPGNIAFSLVLSVIPILTILVFLSSYFPNSMQYIESLLKAFPKDAREILLPYLTRGINMNFLVFMIIGFFLASNGPHAIIIASNTIFNIKEDDFLTSRIKALFMTIIMMILFFFLVVVLGFGDLIFRILLNIDNLSFLTKEIYILFIFIKWPLSFFVIFYFLKVIYTVAPSNSIRSKYMNRGSLFATIASILATSIYSYYVSNFANYDLFYGGLSSIAVLMIWVYIISYIITLGIAINSSDYQELTQTKTNKKKKISNNKNIHI